MCRLSVNPWSFKFLEPKGLIQACIGIALLVPLPAHARWLSVRSARWNGVWLCCPNTDTVCHEIFLWENFTEVVNTFKFRLNSDSNNKHFT
jgi:hypothetical protein